MTRTLPLLLVLPLAGCELFQNGTDIVGGLLNPLVAEGMMITTVPPDAGVGDSGIGGFDLSSAGIDEGVTLTLFLADAANVTQIDQAPVAGASVSLHGSDVTDAGAGLYTLAGGGLTYEAESTWNLDIAVEGTSASAALHLPVEPTFTLPALAANTAIDIDLTGQGFDSALVIVMEAGGAVTYSNQPEGIREFYEFTHGGEAVTVVEVPGEAFPNNGFYAVGVAGLTHTVAEDLTEMNTALTSIMAGKMVFETASVGM
ncbi:MAG: hypothetical protein KC912_00965 [Proteobacteria bacterium]|nr:hypothetical protein [Pseudomonadota bacterium]